METPARNTSIQHVLWCLKLIQKAIAHDQDFLLSIRSTTRNFGQSSDCTRHRCYDRGRNSISRALGPGRSADCTLAGRSSFHCRLLRCGCSRNGTSKDRPFGSGHRRAYRVLDHHSGIPLHSLNPGIGNCRLSTSGYLETLARQRSRCTTQGGSWHSSG